MIKKLTLGTLLVLVALAVSGCFGGGNKNLNNVVNAPETTNQAADLSANQSGDAVVTQNEPVLKRFYPEITRVDKKDINQDGMPNDAERGFVITQELIVQLYLIDKFNPGVCFGLPGPVPEEAVTSVLSSNLVLAKFLKDKYRLSTDLDVYNKIRQIKAITLQKIVGGKYNFSFMDGQCCTLMYYKGRVNVIGNDISDEVTDQETKTNPC